MQQYGTVSQSAVSGDNTIPANLQLLSLPEQQLMLMDEEEHIPNPIIGQRSRHPEDDSSYMNSTAAKIHKTNNDTMFERHRATPKLTDG